MSLPPDLAELIALAEAEPAPVDFPAAAPAPGESAERWAAGVARLRARHDAYALERTRLSGANAAPEQPVATAYADVPVNGTVLGARVYTPAGPGPHPAILLLHGGGWWMGGGATGFELNDPMCRDLALGAGAVVVNLDYRLAPDFKFPTQHEDAYGALVWIVDHAGELGVDPARVAILGISSAGGVAAAACRVARERGGPTIAAQILQSPSLDMTASLRAVPPSDDERRLMTALRALYASEVTDWAVPYLSPALADDLAGLPPAVIVTGEFDALRWDGETYARRLAAAGVAVTHLHYPMTHVLATGPVREQMRAERLAAIVARLR